MEYDLNQVKILFDIASSVVVMAVAIYVWFINRTDANKKKIEELEKDIDGRLDDHAERLTGIEVSIDHLPDNKAVERIHNRIDQVAQATTRIEGILSMVQGNTQMLHQHQLDKGLNNES